ncbi:MAG: alkylation response protein AidB-like acyl-CoA dehydrogenase [Kiritimatiellia bacterium]|jgi:alkylation response protein AidB-like acyl-CoA dehydrogenase
MDQLADLELHGLCLPEYLGGMNCPFVIYLLNAEIMGRADVSIMAHHSFHGGMAMAMLMYSVIEGSSQLDLEQGRLLSSRFDEPIREILAGRAWGSMDITEADAGSDMAQLRTRGEVDDAGAWTVTGQKIFITSGHGRYHFVLARTEDATADDPMAGLAGLSLFLVEAYSVDDSGDKVWRATVSRVEEKLGHHMSATVTVDFEQTPAQLIGKRGDGFKLMLLIMNNARISVGFESLGLCESAWRMARDYAQQRRSMGKAIARHEMLADWLDEMQTDIEGIRALAVAAAIREESCQRKTLEMLYLHGENSAERKALEVEVKALRWQSRLVTPLVKLRSSEKAVQIARRCLQIHGGHGYMTEYGAEKLLRDALVLPIYEGTTQIQALMATKDSLLWIMKNQGAFIRSMADARWRATTSDALGKRVAAIRYQALSAQRALILRILKRKFRTTKGLSLSDRRMAFTSWEPRTDFAPALLHAERLAQILTDAAIVEELHKQAVAHPERTSVLLRSLRRAEPRCRDLVYRIQQTGDALLDELENQDADIDMQAAAK